MVDPVTIAAAAVAVAAIKNESAKFAPLTKEQFITAINASVERSLNVTGDAARTITALACYESGYGRTVNGRGKPTAATVFNFFNMTAGSQWNARDLPTLFVSEADTHYDEATGQSTLISQEWRVYPNMDSGIKGFYEFMGDAWNNGRYKIALNKILNADIRGAATEMRLRGYFTAPLTAYIQGWTNAFNEVRKYV